MLLQQLSMVHVYNGVIIVTTKSGKEGKTQVSFGASLGFKKIAKETKVMILTTTLSISMK